jgi:hypothetical protein
MNWISTADQLPQGGVRVLFCFRNDLDKHRTALGCYSLARTEESHIDNCDGDCVDCSIGDMDNNGQCWRPEGWYEEPNEAEFYKHLSRKPPVSTGG